MIHRPLSLSAWPVCSHEGRGAATFFSPSAEQPVDGLLYLATKHHVSLPQILRGLDIAADDVVRSEGDREQRGSPIAHQTSKDSEESTHFSLRTGKTGNVIYVANHYQDKSMVQYYDFQADRSGQ